MNILYVAPDIPVPPTGDFVGGSTHVIKIAESLSRRGYRVIIVSRRMHGQKKYESVRENIFTRRVYRGLIFPIRRKPSSKEQERKKFRGLMKLIERAYFLFYRFVLVLFVLRLLKRLRIDTILDRSSSGGIGVFAGFLGGVPTIVELLDPDYSKVSLRFAHKIVAYTKNIVDPRLHDKVELVSAGVDTTLFKPRGENGLDIRRKYHLEDTHVIVYVGSLSAWHGAEDLIDIAAELESDVSILMIGKELAILEENAKRKGVYDKLVFTGFVAHEEVPTYISAANVAVAPYNPNGFRAMERFGFYFSPIKIFEYMACSKPVVASDLEIIRDIISENECGLLARAGDAKDFAKKIGVLLRDEELRFRFGENGRKAVIGKYTWDHVGEKIDYLLREIAKKERAIW